MAITHSGKAKSIHRRASGQRTSLITLRPTPQMAEALERLCDEIGAPIEGVMTQAVALYMLAVAGQKKGYGICLVDEDSKIVEEIVNFGIPEEYEDVEPSPSAGLSGLDS